MAAAGAARLPLRGIIGSGADVAGADLRGIVSHLKEACGMPRTGLKVPEETGVSGGEDMAALVRRLTTEKQHLAAEVRICGG